MAKINNNPVKNEKTAVKAIKNSKINVITNFIREAKAELKKVTWPTKKQIWYWTLVVIIFTLCVSLYLGLVDFLLAWLFSALLG